MYIVVKWHDIWILFKTLQKKFEEEYTKQMGQNHENWWFCEDLVFLFTFVYLNFFIRFFTYEMKIIWHL